MHNHKINIVQIGLTSNFNSDKKYEIFFFQTKSAFGLLCKSLLSIDEEKLDFDWIMIATEVGFKIRLNLIYDTKLKNICLPV